MRQLVIFLFIAAMGYTANAQRFHRFESDWKVSVGLNAIGTTGTRNPVKNLGDYGFQFPIIVALEHQWTENFAIEQDLSLNGFKAGKLLDNGIATEDLTYFSTNTSVKWYFSDYLFDLEWLELYAKGGIGIFYLGELNSSANLSGGALFWVTEDIGISILTNAKFAVNAKNREFANNHYQHVLQVVFRL